MKVTKLDVKNNTINEGYSSSTPAKDRLIDMIHDGVVNTSEMCLEFIKWMSEDDIAMFAREYEYFPEENFDEENT